MWKTCDPMAYPNLPKKRWDSSLPEELTPPQCLRAGAQGSLHTGQGIPNLSQRIKIPNAFPWRTQPFQEETQSRIWEEPPTFVLGNHRQELAGEGGDTKSEEINTKPDPKFYVQIQSRAGRARLPIPRRAGL